MNENNVLNKLKVTSDNTVSVCLFDMEHDKVMQDLKDSSHLFEDDLNNAADSNIYHKDEEELYIATSPSFSAEINKNSLPSFYDDNSVVSMCKEKSNEEKGSCPSPSFPLQQDLHTSQFDNIDINEGVSNSEFISLKTSDSYSIVNTIDGQNFFVSSDYSLGTDVSKAYFYVLSPMANTPLIQAQVNDNISTSTFDTTKLINDVVSNNKNSCVDTSTVSSKDNLLTDAKCNLTNDFEDTNKVQLNQSNSTTEEHKTSDAPSNAYNELDDEFDFVHGIAAKSSNQVVWQRISLTEVEVVEKDKEDPHPILMKLHSEAKMQVPLLHGQPYLQVALVNDMDQSSTNELVSTNQILGVPIPEVFSCKWDGCGIHKLSRDHLIQHVNNNHVQANESMLYVCHWKDCVRFQKPFDARYKMLIHLRTHTGEKPHVCNVEGCQASFARIENLKIHVRSHTGERPYPCQHEGCGRSFANSSDRFKHKRTHSEKKPYKCPILGCEKSYTDPSSLRKHKKRPHKIIGTSANSFPIS